MTITIPKEIAKPRKKQNGKLKLRVSLLFRRICWHIHAYLTIFGFMVLTLGSLLLLHLHWLSHKLQLRLVHHKGTGNRVEILARTKE